MQPVPKRTLQKMPQVANSLYLTRTEEIFHCKVKIKIPQQYGKTLLDQCFALLHAVNIRYNAYESTSFFNSINHNAGQWVATDFNTVQMLTVLKDISIATDGAFDITAMPLIKAWGFYDHASQIPSETKIKEALNKVDFTTIAVDDVHVKIDSEQELITGAFVKAFAVDQVIQFLKNEGVTEALINAGGSSIYAISENENHWHVNVPHPLATDNVLLQLPLNNSSLSLSSTSKYDRWISGKRYSHILNAKTGDPSQTLQVGVLTDAAFLGDALATALYSIEANAFYTVVDQLSKKFSFSAYHIDADKNYRHHNFNPKQSIAL